MNPEQDFIQQKTAVVLDTRVLAKRCLDLEKEISEWRERCVGLENEVNRIQDQHKTQKNLIDFASGELKRFKQCIHGNIRAVMHHSNNRDRLNYLQSKIEDKFTSPQEIVRIHQTLEEEVCHLYPSQPQSRPYRSNISQPMKNHSILAYRFAETNS